MNPQDQAAKSFLLTLLVRNCKDTIKGDPAAAYWLSTAGAALAVALGVAQDEEQVRAWAQNPAREYPQDGDGVWVNSAMIQKLSGYSKSTVEGALRDAELPSVKSLDRVPKWLARTKDVQRWVGLKARKHG